MRVTILDQVEFDSPDSEQFLLVARATKHECKSIADFTSKSQHYLEGCPFHGKPIRAARPHDASWAIELIKHATGFQLHADAIVNLTVYSDTGLEKDILIESEHLWFLCSWYTTA